MKIAKNSTDLSMYMLIKMAEGKIRSDVSVTRAGIEVTCTMEIFGDKYVGKATSVSKAENSREARINAAKREARDIVFKKFTFAHKSSRNMCGEAMIDSLYN